MRWPLFWWILAVTTTVGTVFYLLWPVLLPFLVAMLFAYIGDPLVDRLEQFGMLRIWAVLSVFSVLSLIVLTGLLFVLPLLQQQIITLISRIPDAILWVQQQGLPLVAQWLPLDMQQFSTAKLLEQLQLTNPLQQGGKTMSTLFGVLSQSGMAVIYWISVLLLIPVITFYMLRDWDIWVAYVAKWIPRSIYPTVALFAKEADEMLSAFFRGQLLVAMSLGTIYSVGLWLVGLEFSLIIGMIAGMVSIAPYLGLIVGMSMATIATLIQFHSFEPLLWVGLVFIVAQMIEGILLTPLLLGNSIGLHPVVVLFVVLAGGELFGFWGVLFALPISAVAAVWLQHGVQRYFRSELYGR